MRTVAETDGLGDPTRISRPVIILSPPRSGSTLLFEALARSPDLWTIGGESHAVFEGLLDLAHGYHLVGVVGGEVSADHAATQLDPESQSAWSRYAHALARSDRVSDCIVACERALGLGAEDEVSDLLVRARALLPRVLPAA